MGPREFPQERADDPETGTKNWSYRTIPLVAPLRSLLLRIKDKLVEPPDADELICRVQECQKSMDRAAKALSSAPPSPV